MIKQLKLVLSLVLFAACVFLCQQIISHSISNQKNKQDSAEINHIKYGLFSVNEWKKQISVIIGEELNKLNLSSTNAKDLKALVEVQLNGLIDNVDQKIRQTNKGTAKGWMKQSVINAVVDIKDIKAGIPEYADAIIAEMTKAKTEAHVKSLVKKRIDKYFDKTFEAQDLSQLTRIMLGTATPDIESARVKLSEEVESTQNLIYQFTWTLIALSIVIFLLPAFGKAPLPAPQYVVMLLTLLVLLLAGVTTPMIDMEAKISEMSFVLLDHPIRFVNQVLYFQTKSILDVFWIMITHKDLQMKIVGILMVTFSVAFPLLKMISSLAYYYDFHRAKQNSWVKFFVLKSGKWSMTDVLIVAIFMAYIGFNGIITSQFGKLNSAGQDMVILTTNGTSLQPGFYIFLTYTLLALFLSSYLIRERPPV
jgi:hypothetical protein